MCVTTRGDRQIYEYGAAMTRRKNLTTLPTTISALCNSDALGEVAGLVDVAAPQHCHVVAQELQRHYGQQGLEEVFHGGDIKDFIGQLGDAAIPFGGDRNHRPAAGLDF